MKGVAPILFVSALLSLGMGSCSTTMEEVCRSQIPEFKHEIDEAQLAISELAPALPVLESPNRAIASVDESGSARSAEPAESAENDESGMSVSRKRFPLSDKQKSRWKEWSEKRLVETERYLSYVSVRSELNPVNVPLSDLARQLVSFYGYTDQGQLYRMSATLMHAREDADAAIQQGCSAR